jgi:hypothetical protein
MAETAERILPDPGFDLGVSGLAHEETMVFENVNPRHTAEIQLDLGTVGGRAALLAVVLG